ncbi:hypothetical protein HPP92_001170 [Vanilla planifolia]|uniref:C2 domain-containing protein n=2 Tax=Vanilla planifolia TaxID=51239 RepID=A0A835VLA9_VANPL|nr:hypothetical protein HPP92_001170 [Vanilla planifolia]
MAYRALDLTLMSAKDLKSVNLFTPMRVYAIVSLSSDGPRSRQRIAPDRDGGCNPNWNTTLQFTVPAGDSGSLILRIILRAERFLGDRDVGFVHIPLLGLVAATAPQFLSYQVRRPLSGKPKGVLNLAYKLSDPIVPPPVYPPPPFPSAVPEADKAHREPMTAFPAPYSILPPVYPPVGYYAGYPPYGHGAPAPQMPYVYGPPIQYGYSTPVPAAAAVRATKKGGAGMGVAAGVMGGSSAI